MNGAGVWNREVELSHLRPWSFSKVQKAKRCQYDFYWTYVEPMEPAERAEFFVIGSGVHFVMENALDVVFKRKKPLNYDLLTYFLDRFKKLEPSVDGDSVRKFFPNILKYANAQLRRVGRLKFYYPELELSADRSLLPLKDFNASDAFLRGKIDFVFAVDDAVYVVDHKTNRSREPSKRTKTQLSWYALLVKVFFPEFERFVLDVHNIRYGTVSRIVFTHNDISDFQLRLLPLIDMLEDEFAGKRFSDLVPSPHPEKCRWCDFRNICPEKAVWDGDKVAIAE